MKTIVGMLAMTSLIAASTKVADRMLSPPGGEVELAPVIKLSCKKSGQETTWELTF